ADFLDSVIFYSVLVIFVLAAVPYGTVEPWWKAIFECAMFALALLWIIQGMLSGQWLVRQHRLLIPLIALMVFTVIQTTVPLRSASVSLGPGSGLQPLSFSPYDTQLFVYHLAALIVASGLLLRYTTSRSRLQSLVCVVIGIGLLSTAFGLVRHAFQTQPGFLLPYLQPDSPEVSRGIGFGQFFNHNHFAFLAEMSLGLVLGLMLIRPVRLTRLAWCLVMAIPMWVAVVYSGSRGGLASVTGQVLFVTLLIFVVTSGQELVKEENRQQRVRSFGPFVVTRVVLMASLLIVMVLGVGWVGGDPLAGQLESIPSEFGVKDSDRFSQTNRSSIWPTTWEMIKDHPVAGVGFGGYWIAVTKYHNASGEFTPQQAHNDYLELLASGGLIGVAIGLWFVVGVCKSVLMRLRHPDRLLRALSVGALAGIFAVAIHSVVDFGLHITINTVLFASLLVIATVRSQEADGRWQTAGSQKFDANDS
ncbi:MAG: O-antigen ligase family protein, partial [Pyrinomonadaceae bacterium]|nr:O-antigen ligase family protein [Pyrinomonadaceae bacterium]